MGWYKIQGTDHVVGDDVFAVLLDATREIVRRYMEAWDRPPTRAEWQILMEDSLRPVQQAEGPSASMFAETVKPTGVTISVEHLNVAPESSTGDSVRRAIARAAQAPAQDSAALLEQIRTIVQLRGSLAVDDRDDPDLMTLVAIESELDDVPPPHARERWEPAFLATKDAARNGYLGGRRTDLESALRALAEKWR